MKKYKWKIPKYDKRETAAPHLSAFLEKYFRDTKEEKE